MPRDRLSQTALTSLQLAFDFGRAAGAMAASAQPSAPMQLAGSRQRHRSRGRAHGGSDQRSASQLTAVDEQIAHASAKDKEALVAKRGEISAALDLSKQIQGTVGQIQKFEETSDAHAGGASGGLAAQIADLRRSVPEVRGCRHGRGRRGNGAGCRQGASATGGGSGELRKPPQPRASPPTRETFRPESAGIIALFGKWFSLESARRDLADATKQTDGSPRI